jgi:hypothetical protein
MRSARPPAPVPRRPPGLARLEHDRPRRRRRDVILDTTVRSTAAPRRGRGTATSGPARAGRPSGGRRALPGVLGRDDHQARARPERLKRRTPCGHPGLGRSPGHPRACNTATRSGTGRERLWLDGRLAGAGRLPHPPQQGEVRLARTPKADRPMSYPSRPAAWPWVDPGAASNARLSRPVPARPGSGAIPGASVLRMRPPVWWHPSGSRLPGYQRDDELHG